MVVSEVAKQKSLLVKRKKTPKKYPPANDIIPKRVYPPGHPNFVKPGQLKLNTVPRQSESKDVEVEPKKKSVTRRSNKQSVINSPAEEASPEALLEDDENYEDFIGEHEKQSRSSTMSEYSTPLVGEQQKSVKKTPESFSALALNELEAFNTPPRRLPRQSILSKSSNKRVTFSNPIANYDDDVPRLIRERAEFEKMNSLSDTPVTQLPKRSIALDTYFQVQVAPKIDDKAVKQLCQHMIEVIKLHENEADSDTV